VGKRNACIQRLTQFSLAMRHEAIVCKSVSLSLMTTALRCLFTKPVKLALERD
jgi:hypothetical protein